MGLVTCLWAIKSICTNALGNPKIRNKLIDRYTTARLPQVNSPRPNFGVNLAPKPSPKLYKSKAEAKTETT